MDWRTGVGAWLRRWFELLLRKRRVPLVLQNETTECSVACLAMIAAFYGKALRLADLRRMYPVSLRGLTLRSVVEIASDLGLRARAIRCEPTDLALLNLPVMLHWDLEHFVVLTKVRGSNFWIHDPGRGARTMSAVELGRHFTGIAVEFGRTHSFEPGHGSKGLTLKRLVGRVEGMGKAFVGVLALSFVLELLLLAQPMLLRYTIDLGFLNNDLRLILYLSAIGIVAAVCATGVSYARDRTTVWAGSTLNLRMAHGFFHHSLSLPVSFYEKRLTADLVDRYRSMENIERFMIGELPIAILDGVFTLVSLTILFFVSPAIGGLTLVIFLLFLLYRMMGIPALRNAEELVVSSRAQESGYLIESIQNILAIKVRANESARVGNWLSRFAELLNAQRDLATVQARQRSVRVLFGGIDIALFSVVAFIQFRDQGLGFGTLLAILFYKTHFFARSTGLAERLVNFRMLKIHLERLEDIVDALPERSAAAAGEVEPAPDAAIVLDSVSFRYSQFDPLILDGASLRIGPGEFVALTGPSGSGKTTILKLILGLYLPTAGTVRVDGRSTADAALPALRREFGVVMQADEVLIGTVAQNISFFDPDVDLERVIWCATQACIHSEINALPMGYSTPVGGNAAGLSGGQRQRLLLARALYHRVRFLLLDEGTANLDQERESQVLANLKAMNIATLFIAHAAYPISRADRVLVLEGGGLRERRPQVDPEPDTNEE